jgi:hypothetical protein
MRHYDGLMKTGKIKGMGLHEHGRLNQKSKEKING